MGFRKMPGLTVLTQENKTLKVPRGEGIEHLQEGRTWWEGMEKWEQEQTGGKGKEKKLSSCVRKSCVFILTGKEPKPEQVFFKQKSTSSVFGQSQNRCCCLWGRRWTNCSFICLFLLSFPSALRTKMAW